MTVTHIPQAWQRPAQPSSPSELISFFRDMTCLDASAKSQVLYACESWTLTAELQRRVQAMEMRCYRKILCLSYKDHVANKKVRAKIQQAIGPHEDLLTTVKRRKLQCMVMFLVHQLWPKPSCKAQWKGEENRADRGRGRKTTSGNGQAWSSPSPRG